ncbi:TPA: hypothetical protein ACMUBJ_000953 [Enterococcus faecalis]|nr:ImmA/IrrE family metallo-endopeptidase [Enterococcus faecalis]
MRGKKTRSDVFDINRKSGALILGKNRLDDYATKFLTKYCKDALHEPLPLPVEEILKKMGLKVHEIPLSNNLDIFGCCLLLDGFVNVYDRDTDQYIRTAFKEGTILVDPLSGALHGEGAKRNTLIHEALHWEKDKKYFEILAIKNGNESNDFSPIMCRQSEVHYTPPEGKNTKENEIRWLEWQAHRLAPRILMPKQTFKRKALEFINSYQTENSNSIASCDILIDDLSNFFIVSRQTVKYRLIEVGLKEKISDFKDYNDVYEEIKNSEDFVKITPYELINLVYTNTSLSKWIKTGRFIYVEGYLVLANKQYVTRNNDGTLSLTAKAKRNLSKCVINIRKQNYTEYPNISSDFVGYSILKRVEGVDKRLLTFHPNFQSNLNLDPDDIYKSFQKEISSSYDEVEEIHLMKMIGDPEKSLCNCLWFLMEKRKWSYPEKFNEETGLHTNYHGKIKNDKYNNMSTNTLMALCIGLRLNLRLTSSLFEKSDNKLNYFSDPDKTYIRIMESLPGLSLDDFNAVLVQFGLSELGTKIKE